MFRKPIVAATSGLALVLTCVAGAAAPIAPPPAARSASVPAVRIVDVSQAEPEHRPLAALAYEVVADLARWNAQSSLG